MLKAPRNEFSQPTAFTSLPKKENVMNTRLRFLSLAAVLLFPLVIKGQGPNTSAIDQALGRSGQKTGDVYKVSFPRTDLHISINGMAVQAGLARGSWWALLRSDPKLTVMGAPGFLEKEENRV